jgi:hypothetical protein
MTAYEAVCFVKADEWYPLPNRPKERHKDVRALKFPGEKCPVPGCGGTTGIHSQTGKLFCYSCDMTWQGHWPYGPLGVVQNIGLIR